MSQNTLFCITLRNFHPTPGDLKIEDADRSEVLNSALSQAMNDGFARTVW